jgi:Undecaprenyl-phosphate glucose phosphotransferase
MTAPVSQFRSNAREKDCAPDPGASPAFPDNRAGSKPPLPAAAPLAYRPADFLSYGQRGKVTASSFPSRERGLPGLLTARSIPVLTACADFALVAASTFAAGALYHSAMIGYLPAAEWYIAATLLLAALFVLPCGLSRDYAVSRLVHPGQQCRSVFLHWNTAYLLFAFLLFITHATDFYSRGSLIIQYAAGLGTAAGLRLALAPLIAWCLRGGLLGGKRVAVVGEAVSVALIARQLRAEGNGVDVLGMVRLPTLQEPADPRDPADGHRDIRDAAAAVEDLARKTMLDEVIISMPWSEEARIRLLVESLASVPASIHLAPEGRAAWTHLLTPSCVGPLPTVRLSRAPLSLRDRVLKRCFDLTAGTAILLACLPLFLLIAVCIKLDSRGPVLFRQRRNGFNQREFRIYKFRTMTTLDDGAVIRQATRDDMRITRVGRLLRRTNIDELPQLLNVITGQMSLVGPRPHAVAHNNQYSEKIRLYAKRHNVKPGITGLSQVNGLRGETDSIEKMRHRVENDLRYIDNWSLLLDIKIMLLTISSRKSFQNAY